MGSARLTILAVTVALAATAAAQDRRHHPRNSGEVAAPALALGQERLEIPVGHLPRPGYCRMWFPSRSGSEQPPAGQCPVSDRDMPPGVWLLERPSLQRDYVRVSVYGFEKPARLLAIRLYDARTGRLVDENRADPE